MHLIQTVAKMYCNEPAEDDETFKEYKFSVSGDYMTLHLFRLKIVMKEQYHHILELKI